MGAALVLLVLFIVAGGYWLQAMEKKARALEKQRLQAERDDSGPV